MDDFNMIPCYFTLEELRYMELCISMTAYNQGENNILYTRVLENLEGKIQNEERKV